MARRTLLITYIATYMLAISAIIRTLVAFREESIFSIALVVSGYLVLLFSEPFLIRQSRRLTYLYLFVQTAIICTLAVIIPNVDFWAMLFCPLVVQVMHNFPRRTGFIITGIFALITSVLLFTGLGPEVGLPLVFVYGVIYFLLASFIAIIREAETAREELQKQQIELLETQEALRQSELEKAVTAERSRLARDLHDSVTQSLYSLTLFSEAARHLAKEQGYKNIEQQIKQIGVIGLQALKEMRLLVYELQPPELERGGLVRALRRRLEAVEGRAGVEARVEVEEFVRLPGSVEQELFRIAQEALNNSLKHAAAASVVVYLCQDSGCIEMEIVDDGVGFKPGQLDSGGMGLKNIRERTERLGGTMIVHSKLGEGTNIKVVIEDCIDIEKQISQVEGVPDE
jgi:signal transduction histidine kinase